MTKELQTKKVKYLKKFLELTSAMLITIEEENYDKLMELIDQREEIIQTVNELDDHLKNHQHTPEIKNLLAKAIEIDKEIQGRLEEDKETITELLKNLSSSKRSQKAYHDTKGSIEGILLDEKK